MNVEATRAAITQERTAPYHLRCLGNFRLTKFGQDVTPLGRKTRALIAHLALVGDAVSRERLAGLLWSERGEAQARASLRTALYDLRFLSECVPPLLRADRTAVDLAENLVTIDLDDLAACIAGANFVPIDRSLSPWNGVVLADLDSIDPSFNEWLACERNRRHDHLMASLTNALGSAVSGMPDANVRSIISKLTQIDPLNELVLRLAIHADRCAGDIPALHRRYRRFCQALRAELGVCPSPQTRALFDMLMKPQLER
jgi:DNA-binding SARP family transcriptional activator